MNFQLYRMTLITGLKYTNHNIFNHLLEIPDIKEIIKEEKVSF